MTLAALSAGGIVMFGACYALLLALARLTGRRHLRLAAHAAYLGLVLGAIALASSLSLHGAWFALAALLLVGYYFAPRAIWALTVRIHEHGEAGPATDHRSAPARGSNG